MSNAFDDIADEAFDDELDDAWLIDFDEEDPDDGLWMTVANALDEGGWMNRGDAHEIATWLCDTNPLFFHEDVGEVIPHVDAYLVDRGC